MFENILAPEIQQYVYDHENDDIQELILKNKEILGVSPALVAEQISGRKKAKEKLPTWFHTKKIIYPPTINLEQCSSEVTANFKAKILSSAETNSVADLTGGFGVDTFSFSKYVKEVHYIEPNKDLFEIACHNFKALASEIIGHCSTAEDFVLSQRRKGATFDAIYIDPSRRKSTQRVFKLADCVPDIISLQPELFLLTDKMLIKTSPLLDIQQGLSELKHVSRIYVVAIKNEVKELLFLCINGVEEDPEIHAVNFANENPDVFTIAVADEKALTVSFGDPQQYLYEPNAAIQKAGAFKSVAQFFGLTKIHPNTHFYTRDTLVPDFPGRTFKIEAIVKPDKKELLKFFPEGKANITTRNYPLAPEELKKKTGLKDGGDKFLIGFSGEKKKFLVVGERILVGRS